MQGTLRAPSRSLDQVGPACIACAGGLIRASARASEGGGRRRLPTIRSWPLLAVALLLVTVQHCSAQSQLGSTTAGIASLADLLAAAANVSVLTFAVQNSFALNGAEVLIARPGQTVTVAGVCLAGGCPTLDGGRSSRVLSILSDTLLIRGIYFVGGNASASVTAGGGCVHAVVNTLATFDTTTFLGCTAAGVRIWTLCFPPAAAATLREMMPSGSYGGGCPICVCRRTCAASCGRSSVALH